ncbi:ribonuclease M5 [Vagococcus entomophilus]|uniref:Ribonuclease M5 n=1 Tax=Vagococcus entomophilus TaxID=1160095 RepID=A0A430AGX0_9ENTE|nr:ribonuclease M5 [Vagococcus entomophilus]RSU07150.1 ribonuclease M5 [Vagococcus entomophilus]
MKEKKTIIEEVIVVEGKDDTKRIQEVVQADTIETIGSAINAETLMKIRHAEAIRGVIVFTDPDFSGEKIRKIIAEEIPTVKHAFLARKDAVPSKKGSLGVEHASNQAILEALKNVMTPTDSRLEPEIDKSILIAQGLIAGAKAKKRRERLGELLKIGYTNGKQLEKRLAMFRIEPATFLHAMEKITEEEKHGL